ncbi:unnamed protein product [Sphagnum troendelagicum]|uniref:UDP-N-acetylmuramate dehydrogenase n=1 Tax=Sphagnum jensenii TaxID=128206 RepID=A0ABP0VMM7_9BRYO
MAAGFAMYRGCWAGPSSNVVDYSILFYSPVSDGKRLNVLTRKLSWRVRGKRERVRYKEETRAWNVAACSSVPHVKQEERLSSSSQLGRDEGGKKGEAGGLGEDDDDVPSFSHGKLLSEISSWGIGGPAKLYLEVHDPPQLASALRYCQNHNIPWFVVGKGSNCLFDDRGFDGCIILNRINFVEVLDSGIYRVGSGHAFNIFGMLCSCDGFSGLEFASGIPGTVGGAIFMNAGADGQETADVLQSVEIVTSSGDWCTLSKEREELAYSYRTSPFQKMKHVAAIVAATFQLTPCPNARQRQKLFLDRRRRTQPVAERSAGCVFRNPGTGCESAGALIDAAGLKGMSIGAARVSEKHANFLVNDGAARSQDMQALIALVKKQVYEKLGVQLQEEVQYVPCSSWVDTASVLF